MPAPVTQPERIRPMPSDSTPHIAIIGGGFAGAVTALKLARAAPRPLAITIVESRPSWGAASPTARNPAHLMNGPAKNFTLYPDQPEHLAYWLRNQAERDGWRPPAGVAYADSFAPRHLYGDYVQAELENALAQAPHPIAFKHLAGRARDLDGDGAARWAVRLEDRRQLRADYVVLATGLFPRTLHETGLELDPELVRRGAVIDDLWSEPPPKALARDRDVLVIGSNLSALDAMIHADSHGFAASSTASRGAGCWWRPGAMCSPGPPSWIRRPCPRPCATCCAPCRPRAATSPAPARTGSGWPAQCGHTPARVMDGGQRRRTTALHPPSAPVLGTGTAPRRPESNAWLQDARRAAASAITQAACCACRPPPVAASRSAGARAANRVRRPCWWTAYSTRAVSSSTGPASTTRCCAICWARAWPCRTKPVSASPPTRHRRGRATPWPASGTVCRGSSLARRVLGIQRHRRADRRRRDRDGLGGTVAERGGNRFSRRPERAWAVRPSGPPDVLAQQAVEPERFVLRDARLQRAGDNPSRGALRGPGATGRRSPRRQPARPSRFRRPGDARTSASSHPRPANTVADRDDSGRSRP